MGPTNRDLSPQLPLTALDGAAQPHMVEERGLLGMKFG